MRLSAQRFQFGRYRKVSGHLKSPMVATAYDFRPPKSSVAVRADYGHWSTGMAHVRLIVMFQRSCRADGGTTIPEHATIAAQTVAWMPAATYVTQW